MANVIAFLPWVYTDQPIAVGDVRLLPYCIGQAPGDLPYVTQAEMDGILSAYADRKDCMVEQATLLELADFQAGMSVTGMNADDVANRLFWARTAIAFAALSRRKLFHRHIGYCNFDTYTLIVQRYEPQSSSTLAFTTRRRDG